MGEHSLTQETPNTIHTRACILKTNILNSVIPHVVYFALDVLHTIGNFVIVPAGENMCWTDSSVAKSSIGWL